MNHRDHVNLIKNGIDAGGVWADLGSGTGAFTLALAECIGDDGQIHSVDIDRRAMKKQETRMAVEFPDVAVTYHLSDFTNKLNLPPLDGVLMANSLHYVQDKVPVVTAVRELLKPDGRLVIVEYDTAQGNYAVPYPLTYTMWIELAKKCGFARTELLATRPSRFLGSFFCAASFNGDDDR